MPASQQLGRYQLLDRIAYGGMAEIFRARTFEAAPGEAGRGGEAHVHLVAVKRILGQLAEEPDAVQMLVEEARLTALIDHPNVARVYELARDGSDYFVAMEYVDGKDARALLENAQRTRQPIPVEHAAWVIHEAALGLDHAHGLAAADGRPLSIVHRDVSPSNVLCGYRGEVKVCDFGIAKTVLSRVHTRTGVIKGKVRYMSPEQAYGRALDHRSDLFSLGTVLFELLTLRAPYTGKSEVELIFAVREAKRSTARALRDEVPPALDAILDRMTARSRSERYPRGAEIAADLRAFLDEYKPGYRRGHFAQFMRKTFAAQIEAELRQLETYALWGDGDPSRLGENLIADVLPADAPFTRFTPRPPRASTETGTSRSDAVDVAELQALPTRILTRAQLAGVGVRPVVDGAPDAGRPLGALHAEPTRILALADVAAMGPDTDRSALPPGGEAEDLDAVPTWVRGRPARPSDAEGLAAVGESGAIPLLEADLELID